MAVFAGVYYWYPKVTGKMLNETLGKWHFWLFVIGFHLTFDFMHIPGLLGMPRRIYTYDASRGWEIWNLIVSVGVVFQALGILCWVSISYGRTTRAHLREMIPGTPGHWSGIPLRRRPTTTLPKFRWCEAVGHCGTRSIRKILTGNTSKRILHCRNELRGELFGSSDVYRSAKRDAAGGKLSRQGRDVVPDHGGVRHLLHLRCGLPVLRGQEHERSNSRAGAACALVQLDLPVLQQPHDPAG